jgi:hypothetical protein
MTDKAETGGLNEFENLILAGRDMGVVVGSLTLAGLWSFLNQ